jgi:hypothetical protein
MPRNAKGFAILWVIAMVAILAAIAATAAPYLQEINDNDRVAVTMTRLRVVGQGIINFGAVIRQGGNNTFVFPGKLSYLSNVINATNHTTCGSGAGNLLNGANSVNDWNTNGPFVPFQIPPGGLWTPIGRVSDSIPVRVANGAMFIEIPGVSMNDANLFNFFVDGATGDTVTIVHAAIAGQPDTTTLRMRIFVAGTFNRC